MHAPALIDAVSRSRVSDLDAAGTVTGTWQRHQAENTTHPPQRVLSAKRSHWPSTWREPGSRSLRCEDRVRRRQKVQRMRQLDG